MRAADPGSRSSVSNHSWGTAIDVKLEGRLDGFGDGGTQFGLILLAELFNEEGWYWGRPTTAKIRCILKWVSKR
ncbi:M15 family metallopeptidase [Sulfitobacter porphyrae]|uniref:M15 family metallopeptidase n=1 Tax=Sulfitobacter porphyrae TaxID=1246864 RepID=A0ABW2BAX4_9RHOB